MGKISIDNENQISISLSPLLSYPELLIRPRKYKDYHFGKKEILLKIPLDILRYLLLWLDPVSILSLYSTHSYFMFIVFNDKIWLSVAHQYVYTEFSLDIPIINIIKIAYCLKKKNKPYRDFLILTKLGADIAATYIYKKFGLDKYLLMNERIRIIATAIIAKSAPVSTIRYFLKNGILNVNDTINMICFIRCKRVNVARLILEYGADPNFIVDNKRWLEYAVKHKLYDVIKLLSNNPNLDLDTLGISLKRALLFSSLRIVQSLIYKNSIYRDIFLEQLIETTESIGKIKCHKYFVSLLDNKS